MTENEMFYTSNRLKYIISEKICSYKFRSAMSDKRIACHTRDMLSGYGGSALDTDTLSKKRTVFCRD